MTEILKSGRASTLLQDSQGLTPMHLACLNNQSRVLQGLLNRCAVDSDSDSSDTINPGLTTADNAGRLPIHAAAFVCSIDCCRILKAEYDAAFTLPDRAGRSALFWCIASRASQRFHAQELVRQQSERERESARA